jgi:hypothetical protein
MQFRYVDNGSIDEIVLAEGRKMFYHHMPDKYEKTFIYAIAYYPQHRDILSAFPAPPTFRTHEPFFLGSYTFQVRCLFFCFLILRRLIMQGSGAMRCMYPASREKNEGRAKTPRI